MAISWGSYDNRLRVGIDISQSPASVTYATTSVKLTIKFYVQTDMNSISDNQTLKIKGPGFDTSVGFKMTTPRPGYQHVATKTYTRTLGSSAYTANCSCSLSGAYNGATPSKSRSWTIPKRPAKPATVPNKVGTPTVTPGSNGTTATVKWSAPANNGSAITSYRCLVEGAATGNDYWDRRVTTTSGSVTGLKPGQTYTARVQARNGKGDGPWSDKRTFTTKALVPSKPATPTVTNISYQSVRVNYSNPASNGSAITAWTVRLEDASGKLIQDNSDGTGPPYYDGTRPLVPGMSYRVRVRVKNGVGWSAWSEPRAFTTKSAVFVGDGKAWGPALVYVGDGKAWKAADVKTGNGSAWKP